MGMERIRRGELFRKGSISKEHFTGKLFPKPFFDGTLLRELFSMELLPDTVKIRDIM
jgi:hypothetical protein